MLYSRVSKTDLLRKIKYINQAISSAIYLLGNEIQCVEDEELTEEYQEVIDQLSKALQLTGEMYNPLEFEGG